MRKQSPPSPSPGLPSRAAAGARAVARALLLAALPAVAGPQLVQEANLRAAVGVPYVYNATGALLATGTSPLTYAACGGPAGFHVDATTGAVRWTPEAAGLVGVCVSATDATGTTSFPFFVGVSDGAPPPPTVRAWATPVLGAAPLAVTLDASESTAGSSEALPLFFTWAPGDASPAMHEASPLHTYRVPGGYVARVEVRDAYGSRADGQVSVQVKDAAGHVPPRARIVASALQGRDALSVDFTCDCAPGGSPLVAYRWELGEGTLSSEASASAWYGPGRYHARLTVVDADGLAAWDEVEVVVSQGEREPPECRAEASWAGGPSPVETTWTAHAVAPAGSVAELFWWVDDAGERTTRTVPAQYAEPGWYAGFLKVVDDAGLKCTDQAEVAVLGQGGALPPRIVSVPAQQARCGEAYVSAEGAPLRALGTGTMAWRLEEGPAGFDVEEDGTFHWLPTPAQRGPQKVVLEARSDTGRDRQDFYVEVSCPDSLDFHTGSGCGAAGGALAAPALLLLGAVLRRRRARAPRARGA